MPFGIDLLAAFSQENSFSDPIMNAVGLTALQVISFSSSSSTQQPQLLPFGCALQETHQTPLSLKSFYVGSFMYESLMHMANLDMQLCKGITGGQPRMQSKLFPMPKATPEIYPCVQVGLTDMLQEEYGIVPQGFLGHSGGEIACAYADGGFTREQVSQISPSL